MKLEQQPQAATADYMTSSNKKAPSGTAAIAAKEDQQAVTGPSPERLLPYSGLGCTHSAYILRLHAIYVRQICRSLSNRPDDTAEPWRREEFMTHSTLLYQVPV